MHLCKKTSSMFNEGSVLRGSMKGNGNLEYGKFETGYTEEKQKGLFYCKK